MTDAHEIATIVRQQNWKSGGCLIVDHNEAAGLIEAYARTVAAEAVSKATAQVYDEIIAKLAETAKPPVPA